MRFVRYGDGQHSGLNRLFWKKKSSPSGSGTWVPVYMFAFSVSSVMVAPLFGMHATLDSTKSSATAKM